MESKSNLIDFLKNGKSYENLQRLLEQIDFTL